MLIEKSSPEFRALLRKLIWNARLPELRSPAVIAQPTSAADVAAAFKIARDRGLKVSLRSSGHNYQGAALRDGAMLIDMGGFESIDIDARAKRAWVGAGVKGGRLIKELAAYGLAFPIGHCADVALGGYILSGGIGWNYGEWGPACASVSAVELVTTSGETLVADENRNAELFWASRGAGLMFPAAVTRYHLNLHEEPQASFALNATFEISSAREIATWFNEAGASADRTTEIICLVGPDPETAQPSVTVRLVASGEDAAVAQAKLGQLLQIPVEAKLLKPVERKELSFPELTTLSAMPNDKRVAADQIWSDRPIGDLLLAVQHLAGIPQASSAISLTALGAGSRAPWTADGREGALSVLGRTSAGVYALWNRAENDPLHLSWMAQVMTSLAPVKSGRYVGEADVIGNSKARVECYGALVETRLKELCCSSDVVALLT